MINITDTEAAYIAGFIDGEGTINVVHAKYAGKPRGQFVVTISADNVDPRPCLWIQSKVGGAVWIIRERRANRRDRTRWHITGTDCEALLRRLLPFFINKQEKALIALQMRASINESRNRPVSAAEFQHRLQLCAAAKEHSL